jgi:hypothetical protein
MIEKIAAGARRYVGPGGLAIHPKVITAWAVRLEVVAHQPGSDLSFDRLRSLATRNKKETTPAPMNWVFPFPHSPAGFPIRLAVDGTPAGPPRFVP